MAYLNVIRMTTNVTLLSRCRLDQHIGVDYILAKAEAVLLQLMENGVEERLPEEARRGLLEPITPGLMYLQWCCNHHVDRLHLYDNFYSRCIRTGVQYLLDDYWPLVTDEAQRVLWQDFVSNVDIALFDQRLRSLERFDDAGRADIDAPASHWWWD